MALKAFKTLKELHTDLRLLKFSVLKKELRLFLTTLKVFNTEKGHRPCHKVFNTKKGLRHFLRTLKVFNIEKGLHHLLETLKSFNFEKHSKLKLLRVSRK